METDKVWYRVTDDRGIEQFVSAYPGGVVVVGEGDKIEPVVIVTVEEHKRLLAAVDALDILRKVSWDLARRK
jgi:hypothetical protein